MSEEWGFEYGAHEVVVRTKSHELGASHRVLDSKVVVWNHNRFTSEYAARRNVERAPLAAEN